MTERGFPWNSIEGDIRILSADEIALAYKALINNGVFDYENDFLVEITQEGMNSNTINITSGLACIDGHFFSFNGKETLKLPEGEITSEDIYPGLIVLKCRPEIQHRDFVFEVKYAEDGTEPEVAEYEIPLYRFKPAPNALSSEFKRVVEIAKPKNMFLSVLKDSPNSRSRIEYTKPLNDGTGRAIDGLFLYSSDATTDEPYAQITGVKHATFGNCTVYHFLNGVLISDPSLSMMISMVPNNFMIKMPDGTIPFENNQRDDPYTAMRWQNSNGSKNTQIVCKQDKLMCYINGTGTQLAAWSSDVSLKKNIKDIELPALDLLMKIQHKQFDWKATNQHQSIGYIANQLKELSEDFVIEVPQEDGNILLQVNETSVVPLLSKAIQEQQKIIYNLQERLENLEKKVSENG